MPKILEFHEKYPEFFKPYYFGYAHKLDFDAPRLEKYYNQFITTGVDNTYSWNADITITKFIVATLTNYTENINGFPCSLDSDKEGVGLRRWKKILEKIIKQLSLYKDNIQGTETNIDKGLSLLFYWFKDLWD